MKTTKLGQTGLQVTRLGLGLAALGRPGYITLGHHQDLAEGHDETMMEQRAHTVLDAAWTAGIRYFDTARSYGLGELFLSTWLHSRRIPKESVTVASKWGYTYTADWKIKAEFHEIKDHSLPVLQRQWLESYELLKGYLQLYQIHSATLDSGVLDNTDVMHELARLKSRGIRIGLSLSGPEQGTTLNKAVALQIDGVRLFDTVQATWNLLETSAGPALQEAHAAGMGVIIKEALANGRLTERNEVAEFALPFATLRNEAHRLGTSIDGLALAACLAQPFADVVLSGAANVVHLFSNTKADVVKLDSEATVKLKTLAESPKTYWAIRKSLEWN